MSKVLAIVFLAASAVGACGGGDENEEGACEAATSDSPPKEQCHSPYYKESCGVVPGGRFTAGAACTALGYVECPSARATFGKTAADCP